VQKPWHKLATALSCVYMCTCQAFENLCDFLVALLPDVDPHLFLPWVSPCVTEMVAASMQRYGAWKQSGSETVQECTLS
jgi:hypothetical protein